MPCVRMYERICEQYTSSSNDSLDNMKKSDETTKEMEKKKRRNEDKREKKVPAHSVSLCYGLHMMMMTRFAVR